MNYERPRFILIKAVNSELCPDAGHQFTRIDVRLKEGEKDHASRIRIIGDYADPENICKALQTKIQEILDLHDSDIDGVMKAVAGATAADVSPVVHAHYKGPFCSNCGRPMATDCWGGGMERNKYCYYCGAKMDDPKGD